MTFTTDKPNFSLIGLTKSIQLKVKKKRHNFLLHPNKVNFQLFGPHLGQFNFSKQLFRYASPAEKGRSTVYIQISPAGHISFNDLWVRGLLECGAYFVHHGEQTHHYFKTLKLLY